MKKLNINKNVVTTILFQLLNISYGLILPRIIILSYGSEMNGLVSATLYLIGYMKIVETGLSAASIRQFFAPLVNKDSSKISDLFQSVNYYYKKIAKYFLGLSLVFAAVYSYIVSSNVSNIYVFILVIILSLSSYFDFAFAIKYYVYFLANNTVYKYQIAQISSQISKILIVLTCAYFKLDILILLFCLSLTVFVKVYFLSKSFKREKVELEDKFQLVKIDQRNSVLSHQMLGLIIYNGPVILISIFIGARFASIFAVYSLIFGAFYGFFSLIYSQTLLPQLGQAITKANKDEVKNLHEKFNKISIIINLVIIITTVIMFKSFIELYTAGADIPYYDYSTAILFSVYTFLNSLKIPYQTLVNANGDFKNTIIHSVVEVVIFLLTLLLLIKTNSIKIFVLALLLSSLYKLISLKIFSNLYIVKEAKRQHYFQLISILILLIVCVYINTLFKLNIDNVVEWIITSIIMVIISSIICAIFNIIPEKCIKLFKLRGIN